MTATDAALRAIERLRAEHGPLAFFQSGGCCDGSLPICLKQGELAPSADDTLLGTIGGAPFYVDIDLYRRWGSPRFLVDLRPGAAEGFSLSPPHSHFVTRPPDVPAQKGSRHLGAATARSSRTRPASRLDVGPAGPPRAPSQPPPRPPEPGSGS